MTTTRRAFANSLLGAAAGGALVASARPVSAQTVTPITVAAITSDISAEAYYAVDMGFFKKYNLDPKIIPFTNGAAIAAAVASGAADVGYSNVISLAIAHTKGLPFTIVAPANLHVANSPTAGIMGVKKSGSIESAKDLNGKIIAVIGLNNIADIATRNWIDKNGGDAKTVKFVELPFPQMSPALIAGRVDGASMDTVGDRTKGQPDDPIRRIGSTFDSVSPLFAPSVWFTTSDWVKKNPAAAKAYVQAMHDTAVWANTHRKESAAILAKYTKQPLEQIETLTRATYGDKITPELIQPDIDVAAKYGVIKASFSAADIISYP